VTGVAAPAELLPKLAAPATASLLYQTAHDLRWLIDDLRKRYPRPSRG
jgi:hypothetical protein